MKKRNELGARICTLVFLRDFGRVWLANKKHKIGKGKLTGYGGNMEDEDASVEDTALRETGQESGATCLSLSMFEKVAVIDFYDGAEYVAECHTYFCRKDLEGLEKWAAEELKGSDEMGPAEYFNLWGVPYERMMATDEKWFSQLLKLERGEKLHIRVNYDPSIEPEFSPLLEEVPLA